MLRYFQKLITYIVTSINRVPISSDEKTRLQHYSVFLLLGIPTMVIYGLYNFIEANYLLFTLILLSATGLIVGWFLLMYLRIGRIVYRINTLLFCLLVLYMVLIGGEGGSKILWMYIFPLISFFLFGKNEGLFWSITVILIATILLWNPFNLPNAYNYPNELKIRFLTTYLIVSAVTYWFEYFRYRYRIDVELKNQRLKKEITDRKQAEKALIESEERYKTIFNTVPTSIILIDKDGQIVDINPYHLAHISKGRAGKEDFIGANIITRPSIISADLTETYRKVLLGEPFDLKDVYFPTLTRGTDGYLSVKGMPLYRDDKVIGAVITHEDVTDRKQAEEALRRSEEKYHSLYNLLRLMCDNVPDMIWAKDLEKKYIFTNKAICENLLNAKDTDEPVGRTDIFFAERERAVHPENSNWHDFGEICADSDSSVMESKKPERFDEFGNVKGKFLYLDVYKAPFWDEHGEMIGTVGCGRDVTKNKKIEELVKASLKEKEILLREIHHRVKNNLAVISSLLSMQANIVTDRDVHLALQESQSRVKAMALIHDTLYQSESLALVDLESYVKDLISNIVSAFDGITGRTNFEIDVRDIKLEVSQAAPCGLIINELATNALKHAFADGQKGVVRITAGYTEDKEVELTVSDNGIGFSGELDWKKSKNLGLRLISLMVDQLHGTLDIRNHHGAEIAIKWPAQVM